MVLFIIPNHYLQFMKISNLEITVKSILSLLGVITIVGITYYGSQYIFNNSVSQQQTCLWGCNQQQNYNVYNQNFTSDGTKITTSTEPNNTTSNGTNVNGKIDAYINLVNLGVTNVYGFETITVKLRTDIYGVVPYFSGQILTIGECYCENGKTVYCELFDQYKNKTPIESVQTNYTIFDYGTNLC